MPINSGNEIQNSKMQHSIIQGTESSAVSKWAAGVALALATFAAEARADLIYNFGDFSQLRAGPNEATPNVVSPFTTSTAIAPITGLTLPYDVTRISIVFGTQDIFGTPNVGDLDSISGWRFKAFGSLNELQSDPAGNSAGSFYDFAAPTNGDWRNVVGTVDGFNLRVAEFTLPNGVRVTNDSFVSIFPIVTDPLTLLGLPQATGVGSVGAPTWVYSDAIGGYLGPQSGAGARWDYSAIRVEATAVPEPSSGLLTLFIGSSAAAWYASRRRQTASSAQ
jgi:hypothetical protein